MSKPDTNDGITMKKEKKKKGFVRENIESILIAVALAFLLRVFVVEAFKIPTGSMAPTLLGQHKSVSCPNCDWKFKSNHNISFVKCSNCFYRIRLSEYGRRGGNRILVNKFVYDFGKPERWDISVFKYPFIETGCISCGSTSSQSVICEECTDGVERENYFVSKVNRVKGAFGINQYHKVVCNSCKKVSAVICESCGSANVHVVRKNYIKRLIGLPGEKLQIANGDIYVNEEIQRKPEKIQRSLLVPVYNSNYPPSQKIVESWEANDDYWEISESQLYLKASGEKGQASYISFKREIADYSAYNSEQSNSISGDIMIRFDATANATDGGISVVLEEDEKVIEAFIRLNQEGNKSHLKVSGEIVKSNPEVYIESGNQCSIEFSNIDNRVILKLNDAVVFSYTYDDELSSLKVNTESSTVRLGGVGTAAVFKDISIFRDVYYTDAGEWGTQNPVNIGEKEYFFLGDNSGNSNDSRYWRFVPESNMVGKAFMVFWPLSTVKFVK